MTEYFYQLYCRKNTFDDKDMKHYLYNPNELCFETASKKFRLIDDDCMNIIVNWGNSMGACGKTERIWLYLSLDEATG